MGKELFSVEGNKFTVESVRSEFIHYLKENVALRIILPFGICGAGYLALFLYVNKTGRIEPDMFLVPLMPLFIAHGWLYQKARGRFLKAFARENGLLYREKGAASEFEGLLFTLGRNGTARHIIEGRLNDRPFRMFDYSYEIGAGKNKRIKNFGVAEIIYNSNFSNVVLQSSDTKYNIWNLGAGLREINLEDKYKKKFKLFCCDGYEIEALQIFSTDLLEFLTNNVSGLTIDLSENRINVYDDHLINSRAELIKVYSAIGVLITKLGTLPERLKNDFEALHPYYKK